MARNTLRSTTSQSAKAHYESLLLKEYQSLDGMDANLSHMRREFCSEFFSLAPKIQELVIAAQSSKSLTRLLQTISRFKNPDTGYLFHQKEIDLIEAEMAKRAQKQSKKITMDQLEKALSSLRYKK